MNAGIPASKQAGSKQAGSRHAGREVGDAAATVELSVPWRPPSPTLMINQTVMRWGRASEERKRG